jgi:hypothetical protein
MEREFIANQEVLKPRDERESSALKEAEDLRGSPLQVGTLEEMIDDNHCIVSTTNGPEYYVCILSIADADLLEPGCSVLLHNKSMAVVGVLGDEADPLVQVMKVEKAPLESYADIGGLDKQVMEMKEAVELPLTHPELYEDIGIKPPKGVILYGEPGTGKTLLAKAVANSTSASFLRVTGSELIQKRVYLMPPPPSPLSGPANRKSLAPFPRFAPPQVSRRRPEARARDLQGGGGQRALHHLHRRDRRHRPQAPRRALERRAGGAAHHARAAQPA